MEKFCVISARRDDYSDDRWSFDNYDDAQEYAISLVRENKLKKALVVKVIDVVELSFPPVNVRPPVSTDFPSLKLALKGDK